MNEQEAYVERRNNVSFYELIFFLNYYSVRYHGCKQKVDRISKLFTSLLLHRYRLIICSRLKNETLRFHFASSSTKRLLQSCCISPEIVRPFCATILRIV